MAVRCRLSSPPSMWMSAPSPAGKENQALSMQAGPRASRRSGEGGASSGAGRRDPRIKAVGGVFWLASAMEVRSRLWLGSVISQHRDGQSIGGLLILVRACGPVEKILLVTDGLSSYKSQGQNNKGRLGRTHSRPPGWKVGPF